MTKFTFAFGLILVFIGSTFADDDTPLFKITMKRSDDRVEVKSENDKVVFIVRSLFGISSVNIERTTELWPDKVLIQLRLKGLENFKVSTEKLKLEMSVSSQTGDVRLWKDGKEDAPLKSKSLYWMELRIVDGDGQPTKVIPLKTGYIEMQLPKILNEGNPKSIKLDWIDFYRN